MTEPTPLSPSPSPEPSPAPTPGGAPAAASPPTPQSPAGSAQTRPDYIPENFWDGQAVKAKEFSEHINQLATRAAAEDSRKLSLPQVPDAYKVALPADFVPPQGVEAKIDEANPLWGQAKAWAHKHGLSQDAFNEAVGLVMGERIGSEAQIRSARDAEVAKLGPAGPARIDALSRFFGSYLGAQEGQAVMARVFTANDVSVMEKLVAKVTGGGAFKHGGREPDLPGRVTDAEFAKMSNAERLNYARQFDQSQFAKAS
jgi:hypothetical protein